MAARPPPRPRPPHCSHTQRRREFTGCGPHEVALLAKPFKRNIVEEAILAERVQQEEQCEQERDLRVFWHYRNACDWYKGGEDKWLHRTAERKVRETLQQYLQEIDVRRERNRCEEYRILCKKQSEKELGDCQLAQQTLKEILKKEEKMQEQKLEEICEKELLAKDEEAELKAQEVAARIREMLDVREAQVAVHTARQEEKKQEIKKEAEWLEQDLHQFRKENEELEKKRRHQQKECRELLLKAVQDKQKHLDAEKQTQLAQEKKILEEDFQDPNRIYAEITTKKQALLKEQLTYLDHLAEQLRREKEQEREDEKLLKEERDQAWAKRVEKMKEEREARFQLLRDVMNTRQTQMEEKLQKKAQRKIEIAEEKKKMAEAIREFEREEEEKRIRKVQKAKEYRDQLTTQIAYQQCLQKAEEEKRKKELESNMEAERKYQERVRLILSMPNESVLKLPTTKKALMLDS
ncbi:cilia- and flagella-associated protein 53 isoform X2 [Parus major]|uniref:cilia- and flagella-associated protein 53 isoform X2 n=1 Tax=Parus major TaxID=9157 RepID=UPI000771200A|nr:cilia- and flagella-associated protein 53 isoform X2 [Parus major]